jgi:hypothetical protein
LAGDNLLKNGGFEAENPETPGKPYDWGVFTETGVPGVSMLNREFARDGKTSFKLGFEGKADRFMGVAQNVPVTAGQKLKFICYVRNLSLQNASQAVLGLEWKDEAGQEIARDIGEQMGTNNTSTKDWTRFELIATAPAKTMSVTAAVSLQTNGSTDGAILIDEVHLEVVQ